VSQYCYYIGADVQNKIVSVYKTEFYLPLVHLVQVLLKNAHRLSEYSVRMAALIKSRTQTSHVLDATLNILWPCRAGVRVLCTLSPLFQEKVLREIFDRKCLKILYKTQLLLGRNSA